MEARTQDNGKAKQEDGLPRKLGLAAALLGWHVGLNQGAPDGPLA